MQRVARLFTKTETATWLFPASRTLFAVNATRRTFAAQSQSLFHTLYNRSTNRNIFSSSGSSSSSTSSSCTTPLLLQRTTGNTHRSVQFAVQQQQQRLRRSTVYIRKMRQWKPPKKLKTKSSVKKRFRLSAVGVLKRRRIGKRHHAWAKSRKQLRRLGHWVNVEGRMKKKIARVMQGPKRNKQ